MFPGATDDGEGSHTADDADRDGANFVVVGAPLDVSTTFQPGTRFGPRRIRTFAEPFDDYDHRTDQYFSELGVEDHGDIRAWDNAKEYLEYLEGTLRGVVWDDAVPLMLGGEHTVSLAGVRAVEPEAVVVLDAHLDLYEAYDGNELSHASVTRRILEESAVEDVFILGARTGSETEWERARAPDVTVVSPEDVADWPLADRLDGRDVYLSVDIDAADPAYAPATGTREPFGLESRELRDVVREVAPYADGFDVVEVNDRDEGQTAALAGKLVREFAFARADGR
ncbi:agmatinase [Haloterrigena salina JCM 13891]|uniref:Agmatinase n=1 Tax=Haloterrigena salina JCM 13891 TaxID=1227488 RepID=M0CBP6_9EURY|nr:agmatinase [Haloterrigena salina]ELZ19329.1 agmatinase [Haloterrigena salina JCM 13891]